MARRRPLCQQPRAFSHASGRASCSCYPTAGVALRPQSRRAPAPPQPAPPCSPRCWQASCCPSAPTAGAPPHHPQPPAVRRPPTAVSCSAASLMWLLGSPATRAWSRPSTSRTTTCRRRGSCVARLPPRIGRSPPPPHRWLLRGSSAFDPNFLCGRPVGRRLQPILSPASCHWWPAICNQHREMAKVTGDPPPSPT
jgi:hypothetical protein